MPLNHEQTEAAFEANVAELIKSGHSREQALAIAYKIRRGEDAAEQSNVGVIYLAGDRVLLLKRKNEPQVWAFPAGKIEEGESADAAAAREFKEETGGDATALHPVEASGISLFVARGQPFDVKLNDESDGYGWFGLHELPEPLHEGTEEALVQALQERYAQDADEDGTWITINGAHVLVDKDGHVVAGAGGKFNGEQYLSRETHGAPISKEQRAEAQKSASAPESGRKKTASEKIIATHAKYGSGGEVRAKALIHKLVGDFKNRENFSVSDLAQELIHNNLARTKDADELAKQLLEESNLVDGLSGKSLTLVKEKIKSAGLSSASAPESRAPNLGHTEGYNQAWAKADAEAKAAGKGENAGSQERADQIRQEQHAAYAKSRAEFLAAAPHPSVKAGHSELYEHLTPERETEKAYGVANKAYRDAVATAKYNVKELSSEQQEMLRRGSGSLTWFPKSQVSTHEGKITGAPAWLFRAKEQEGGGHFEHREGMQRAQQSEERREAAFQEGTKRYNELLDKAKAAGVKGVRVGMRTSTIKEKMRAHGMEVEDALEDVAMDSLLASREFIANLKRLPQGELELIAQDKSEVDANGWREISDNPISKVGVFPYLGKNLPPMPDGTKPDPDRVYKVYRPAEELSNPETIESFKLVPWINGHTMLGDKGVPAEKKGIGGVLGEQVYYDDEDEMMKGNLKIFADSLDAAIENGKVDLSLGYTCTYDWTPGTWKNLTYDLVQRNIRGNHIALVDEGRMGKEVRVQDNADIHEEFLVTFDAKDIIMTEEEKKAAEEKAKKEAEEKAAADKKAKDEAEAKEKADKEEKEKKDTEDDDDDKAEESVEKEKIAQDAIDAAVARALAKDRAERNKRDALVAKLVPIIGVFDSADKSLDEIAVYACDKLAITATKGAEVATLDGWLAGRAAGTVKRMPAQDGKTGGSFVDRYIAAQK